MTTTPTKNESLPELHKLPEHWRQQMREAGMYPQLPCTYADELDAALTEAKQQDDDGWEANFRYLLERSLHTLRSREGGGPENLLQSAILTFTRMEQLLAAKQQGPGEADRAILDAPMRLSVALDFADNPRPYHTLQAPADTNGELYRALRAIAAAYREQRVQEPIGSIDPRHLTLMQGKDGTLSGNVIRLGKSMQPGDTLLYTGPQVEAKRKTGDATDADIQEWLERHDLEHAIRGTDARAAFEDAQTFAAAAKPSEEASNGQD